MRIHLTAVALMIWLTGHYELTGSEYAILFFAMGMVLVAEITNTAVEVLVDLHTRSYHALARVAKDVAAAGVLLSALTSVCVGMAILWRPAVLLDILKGFMQTPTTLLPPFILGVLGVVFVFYWPKYNQKKHPVAGS